MQEIHQYKDMSPFASKAEKSTDKEARETDYSEDWVRPCVCVIVWLFEIDARIVCLIDNLSVSLAPASY